MVLYKKTHQERNTDVIKEGYNIIPIYKILFKNSFNTTIIYFRENFVYIGHIQVTTIKNAGREVISQLFACCLRCVFFNDSEVFSYSFLIYTSVEYTLLIYCVLCYK